jgi:glycosyltransferase involved in cell wall biosynthesis
VRVCYLIDELSRAGTETQLLALIRHLDRRRVAPVLCLLRGRSETSRSLEPDHCSVKRLDVGSLKSPGTMLKAWRFARFLRRARVDVLQVYFPDSTYFGVPAGRLAKVPAVVRTRNNLGHWLTPVHRWLGRRLNRFTTATIANSVAARDALLRAEGPDPARVVVMENGVDLERFAGVPAAGSRPTRCVGIVANLRKVKGVDLFIEAAARVLRWSPGATFRIAGEGNERAALARQAADLGIAGRVTFHGSVTDIPAFVADLDVAVLASRSEGMPNAVLEYMAAGRAVVAARVGGVTQLIEHGRDGLLVPPGDADALGTAIQSLLADREQACRLASAARQRAETEFGRDAMVRRFEEFYENLIENRR